MPTDILNASVPDAPNPAMEMCHEFTYNYLVQKIIGSTSDTRLPYLQPGGNTIYSGLYQLLINCRKQYIAPSTFPIIAGDILIFSTSRNNVTQAPPVTHSMVALSPIVWYGVNNVGTFGAIYSQNTLPGLTRRIDHLRNRSRIDISMLFYNFELLNQVNGLTQQRVPVYQRGIFTTNNPNFTSHTRTPNILPYMQYYIHIFR